MVTTWVSRRHLICKVSGATALMAHKYCPRLRARILFYLTDSILAIFLDLFFILDEQGIHTTLNHPSRVECLVHLANGQIQIYAPHYCVMVGQCYIHSVFTHCKIFLPPLIGKSLLTGVLEGWPVDCVPDIYLILR